MNKNMIVYVSTITAFVYVHLAGVIKISGENYVTGLSLGTLSAVLILACVYYNYGKDKDE